MSDLNGSAAANSSSEITPATPSEIEQVENLLAGRDPIPKPEKAQPNQEAGGDANLETPIEAPPAGESEKVEDPEPDGIDYSQKIPMSNGEPLTLGELKDFYQQHDQKVLELIERENKVMSQYDELQQMTQYLNLPPEAREQIQQRQTAYLQEQHGLMLQAIPEWKDQSAFEKGRAAIFDLGKEYGVDLSRVTDHKVVKMLRDFATLKSAIKSAKASVRQVKQPEPKAVQARNPGGNGQLDQAIATAKRTGNSADQSRAVDMLLRG